MIDKSYFDKIGKYDMHMDIWGGENLGKHFSIVQFLYRLINKQIAFFEKIHQQQIAFSVKTHQQQIAMLSVTLQSIAVNIFTLFILITTFITYAICIS